FGALLLESSLARLRPGGIRARARFLRLPGVPLRGPVTARPRTRGARRPRPGTSTGARVGVAIPWIIFAIAIIHFGGTVFAVALVGLGLVALHELYTIFRPVRPIPLAGFAGMAGLIFAAAYGDQYQMVLASAAS